MESSTVSLKTVWAVSERGPRSYCTRVGVAWQAPDGALRVRLEAVPLSGELAIRDWVPPPDGPLPGADAPRPAERAAASPGEAAR